MCCSTTAGSASAGGNGIIETNSGNGATSTLDSHCLFSVFLQWQNVKIPASKKIDSTAAGRERTDYDQQYRNFTGTFRKYGV
jgi:hypothetical protein